MQGGWILWNCIISKPRRIPKSCFFILYYASFEELQYFMYYQYVQTGELPAASVHAPPVNTDSHNPA